MNCARFAFVVSTNIMVLQEALDKVSCNWTIHMRVADPRTPSRIIVLLLLRITRECSSNNVDHPWLQSWAIDRIPVVIMSGKRCCSHACFGRDGMFR